MPRSELILASKLMNFDASLLSKADTRNSQWEKRFIDRSVFMNATKIHVEAYANLLRTLAKLNPMVQIYSLEYPRESGCIVRGNDYIKAEMAVGKIQPYGLLLELARYVPTEDPIFNEGNARMMGFPERHIYLHYYASNHNDMRAVDLEERFYSFAPDS
jgi:hypothetical protein